MCINMTLSLNSTKNSTIWAQTNIKMLSLFKSFEKLGLIQISIGEIPT